MSLFQNKGTLSKIVASIFSSLLIFSQLNTASANGNFSLSQSTNLQNDQTVQLNGSGYKKNYDIYVAQTIAKPSGNNIPEEYTSEQKIKTDSNGNFSTKITVKKSFNKTNCLNTKCYIATFAAWPNIYKDKSQDNWREISFSSKNSVQLVKKN